MTIAAHGLAVFGPRSFCELLEVERGQCLVILTLVFINS